MTLGPLFFSQPLALLGLLALPIIFWLLRATPPKPKRVALPSLALMAGIAEKEQTPAQTPWWLILLRCLIALFAIIGFSRPIYQPVAPTNTNIERQLIIIDNGWTSAQQWNDITRTAQSIAETTLEKGGAINLIFTAPVPLPHPVSETLGIEALSRTLQSAEPKAWAPDRQHTLSRLKEAELDISQIVWLSDGFHHQAEFDFASSLSEIAPLDVHVLSPPSAFAITAATPSPSGASVELARIPTSDALDVRVTAEDNRGANLSSTNATFEANSATTIAEFSIPSAILNEVARFRINTARSAGTVWLWDDASMVPTVGLVDAASNGQPLLEDYYYIRKALEPNAFIVETSLDSVADQSPDAIILADRDLSAYSEIDSLLAWIKEGGALIRFAGPKLAAATNDPLTPTKLRPATRALGGVLAWDEPQAIAPFDTSKAFARIPQPDANVFVRRQVLAQPSVELANHTWARLEDGTPLVTARQIEQGIVILFHVTATPEWSDLPYDGAFVDMLKRAASAGRGKTQSNQIIEDETLRPYRILNAFGNLETPAGNVAPIPATMFTNARASYDFPPGLYQGAEGNVAVNLGANTPPVINSWPNGANIIQTADMTTRQSLQGLFLLLALALLLLDIFVSLAIAGRFRRNSFGAALALLICFPAISVQDALAQSDSILSAKEREAAIQMRFAYVETNDDSLNRQIDAGLRGLNRELYKRTSVEPAAPHSVRLGVDKLALYPMLYFAPPRNMQPLPPEQIAALNTYLRNGGSLVIDTRDYIPGQRASTQLQTLLKGLDVPPLQPVSQDHVLTRSFYLLDEFPGRYPSGQVWIEANRQSGNTLQGDTVSRIYIGASDWIGAWAIDEAGRPLNPMDGSERQREIAYRFGINLVMCILTGSYKEDQVHLPALLQRLDEENAGNPNASGRTRTIIPSPSEPGPPADLRDFFDSMREERDRREFDQQ